METLFLTMPDQTTETIHLSGDCSIAALKHHLENELFLPVNTQHLISNSVELSDDVLLADLDTDTLNMVYLLPGGCRYKKATSMFRWKWKKKRTRRLQRKRRKMRMRAR